jgi:Holliday junction resolvase
MARTATGPGPAGPRRRTAIASGTAGFPGNAIPLLSFSPSLTRVYTRLPGNRILQERFAITERSRDLYLSATSCFETIGSCTELDAVAEGSAWQDFERLAAFIFEKNGFSVRVGIVKTRGRQRRQYDVIAEKDGRTLLVECKQWAGNRYRLSALKTAVAKHRERALFYESVTGGDAVPVIVVLIEEEIRVFEGMPLVPVHRLNAFIGELEQCTDAFSFGEYEYGDNGAEEPGDLFDEADEIPAGFY